MHFTEKTIKLSSNAVSDTAAITPQISKILENSVVVNELKARENKNQDIKKSFVLIGIATDTSNDYPIRTLVDKYTNDVLECDFYNLYATNAKKEDVSLRLPDYPTNRGSATSSNINISKNNKNVNSKDLLRYIPVKLGLFSRTFLSYLFCYRETYLILQGRDYTPALNYFA